MIDESKLKWNDKALNQLVSWSKIPNFYNGIYKDTLQQAISKNKDFIILTYSGGNVDLKEYLRLLNNVLIPKSDKNTDKDDIKNFLLEAVRTDKIVKKAEDLGLEKTIFNPQTNNPVLKNQIVYLYNLAVVDSQIPEPTGEILHKFYNEQKDSLFYQLKKINIYAMIFPGEKKAEEVMQRIESGTPFEKISGDWFVKTFIRDREGNIKSYFSREEPFLGKAAFKLKLNETAGPVAYNDPEKGKQYAIIKCVNIRPEKQLFFADVKNSIVEDFRNYQREINERS